jgi:hypothetical protein
VATAKRGKRKQSTAAAAAANVSFNFDDDDIFQGKVRPAPKTKKTKKTTAATKTKATSKEAAAKVKPAAGGGIGRFVVSSATSLSSNTRAPAARATIVLDDDDDDDDGGVAAVNDSIVDDIAHGEGGSAAALGEDLWTDKYAPMDTTTLAVHKKKVTDVRGWLTANARTVTELRRGGRADKDARGRPRHRQSLLVLTGPPGTFKRILTRDAVTPFLFCRSVMHTLHLTFIYRHFLLFRQAAARRRWCAR